MGVTSQRMTQRELDELLGQPGCRRDPEVDRIISLNSHVLADGRVLLFSEGEEEGSYECALWDSKQELADFMAAVRDRPVPDTYKGILPEGEHFVEEVPRLVERLGAMLDLPAGTLDYTPDSLAVVDGRLRRLGAEDRIASERLSPVLAYFGEVLRRCSNGRWEMRRAGGDGPWQPLVVAPNGREYDLFSRVWKQIYDISDARGQLRDALPAEY